MFESFKAFVASHLTYLVLAWLATLLVGVATKLAARITGSPKWVEWERVHPALGALGHIIFGFLGDGQRVTAALVMLYQLAFKRSPTGTPPSAPKVPVTIVGGAMLLAFATLPGCAWFQAHPKVLPDGANIAACVIAHAPDLVAAEQQGAGAVQIVEQAIVSDCGAESIQVVADIWRSFQAQKARLAKAAASVRQ